MKRPTVRQVHAICDSLKARAVIVLAFGEIDVAGASYGETKLECQQTGYTLDRILEALESGKIPVWATCGCESFDGRGALMTRIYHGDCEEMYGKEIPVPEHDCREHMKHHRAECVETHGFNNGLFERWTEEWWECAICGEREEDL